MSQKEPSFKRNHPLTWCYHHNTSRWVHNATASTQTGPDAGIPQPALEFPDAPQVRLPAAQLPDAGMDQLLRNRLSCRRFSPQPLALQTLSDLLFVGYGILEIGEFGNLEFLERPVPSGGGLYPLELFAIVNQVSGLESGIYHYRPVGHYLEQLRKVLLPKALREYLIMGQASLAVAPVLLVVASVVGRSLGKYGDRGYRYILLEAGHMMQNVNLAAISHGLGSCNIGGFFDQELGELLCLDPDLAAPLYATAIGHPDSADRRTLRAG
ncbi:MAG: SagB/ThcOx family dehydrogenase [Candidatus Thiodiazotropha sp. (ex Epidulcina cf. delphinae)]|nr:SagB/ThcOx family dehydrogenase [Candidatus Thiodiazotropha sp. (ex Epidulcina cf. delphinae)]